MTKVKSLYTLVVEFRKGIYVSQVKSNSVLEALKTWTNELMPESIKYLDASTVGFLKEELSKKGHEKPTRINGMRNAWFAFLLTKKGGFYINIIKTA